MAAANAPANYGFVPSDEIAGQYRIARQLGKGSNAVVYLAVDTFTNKQVALKFPLYQRQQDFDTLRREVAVGRHVRHANVCKTFATSEVNGVTFAVMEYVEGETLQRLLINNGACEAARAVGWAIDLCAGINAVHQEQIVHRDLKPPNLMIDDNGHLKIMDFGVATLIGSGAREIAGTYNYMAPEQLLGNAARPTADMYAVGVVLYEMFTGKVCLPGNTARDVLDSQKTLPQRTPSIVAGVDRKINDAIMKCLQQLPEDRPDAKTCREDWAGLAKSFTT